MTPKPLHEIRLRWGDHKHALWWLGLLYRKPRLFQEALATGTRSQQLGAGWRLVFHFLPYQVLLCVLGRVLLFGVFRLPTEHRSATVGASLLFHGETIAVAIAVGIALGIAVRIAVGIRGAVAEGIAVAIAVGIPLGTAFGIAGGIALGTAAGVAGGIAFGIAQGVGIGIGSGVALGTGVGVASGVGRGSAARVSLAIALGIFGGVSLGLTNGIVVGIGYGIAVGTTVGIAVGISVGIAVWIAVLRCYYNLFGLIFVWPNVRSNWYPFHPVAWDDCCSVPFWELDRLLAAYAEQNPGAGFAEIQRLIDRYATQRMAALRAWTRLVARHAGAATDLTRLSEIVAGLPEGSKGFLAETPRVRQMVAEIAGLQARLDAMDRPVFREAYAAALCTQIENFQHRVAGFREPLASEFRAAADRWLAIARRQRDEVRLITDREPTIQVFRAGDPVDRNREAFVPRDRVVGRLEQQVMLAAGCPGVVLYGRRRMGKSTVLRNLDGFLPPTVGTAVLSMQNPEAFTSLRSFCELLGTRVHEAWPGGGPPGGPPGDLQGVARLLGDCDRALAAQGRRLILSVDEYENIDRKIGQGVFPEDLLALVRESIQSHRNLTWVFAGSHEIEELTAAPWTSYLVSARTVEVPPFTEDETRLLLTEPLKYSTLWPRDRERPHFAAAFWGEGGIARVHAEAGGWPHLVQLIAETVVDLVNESGQRQVDNALWGRALDEAVVRGHNVFHQLLIGESQVAHESDYLFGFRTHETQPPPTDDAVARSLRRRQLTVLDGDHWRLRAPLFRRWLQRR
jgi:hypothetical protein